MDDYGKDELDITVDPYNSEALSFGIPILYQHHFAHYFSPGQIAATLSCNIALAPTSSASAHAKKPQHPPVEKTGRWRCDFDFFNKDIFI